MKPLNIFTSMNQHIKNNWVAYIPVAILFLVSLRQIYLHNYNFLNRWKGGGFGMFSTIEKRFTHIHLIKKGALECALRPRDFSKKLDQIEHYPSYISLEHLAKKLAKNIWVYSAFDANFNQPTSVEMVPLNKSIDGNSKIAQFDTLELQVYKVTFNRKSFTLNPVLIRRMQATK